jgi:hypothetical protein
MYAFGRAVDHRQLDCLHSVTRGDGFLEAMRHANGYFLLQQACRALTIALAALVCAASSADALGLHGYTGPVDQSGTYQIDCATWYEVDDQPLAGCECPRRANYLRLELVETEPGPSAGSVRMHYTGELDELSATVYRQPCEAEVPLSYECESWVGRHVYPLSGYFDWTYIQTEGLYYIDRNTSLTGTLTTPGLDFNDQAMEQRVQEIAIVVHEGGYVKSKAPDDGLVQVFVQTISGNESGAGGWRSDNFLGGHCGCGLSYVDQVVPPTYPTCDYYGSNADGRAWGDGTSYFTGEQTTLPTILGNIDVTLRSTGDLALPDPTRNSRSIDRAVVQLYRQAGYARQQQNGETDTEYRAYLSTLRREPVFSPQVVTTSWDSEMSWLGVPLNELVGTGGAQHWQDVIYGIEVRKAETDELDLEQNNDPLDPTITIVTYFTDQIVPNVRADVDANPLPYTIELNPLDGIGAKEGLVDSLSMACPENFAATENLVQLYLNQLKDGSIEKTDPVLEGLKRGILAERTTLFGALFARDLIDAMMDGLVNLLQNLVEEVTGKKGAGKAQAARKKKQMQLQDEIDELKGRMDFRGWTDFEASHLNNLQGALDTLNDSHQMLLSTSVAVMKAGLKVGFVVINQGLTLLNLDEGKVAAFISNFQKVLFAFLDGAIHQGLGALEQGVKFIISQLGGVAKEALYDGSNPAAYCAQAQPDLEYSRLHMESWNEFDRGVYVANRDEVMTALSNLSSESAEILGAAAWADFANEAGDLVETVSSFVPLAGANKALEWAGWLAKYAGNLTQFTGPAIMLFRTGSVTEEHVKTSFNDAVLPGFVAALPPRPSQLVVGDQSPHLLIHVDEADVALTTALDALAADLATDSIASAIDVSGSDAEDALPIARAAWQRALDRFLTQAGGLEALGYSGEGYLSVVLDQYVSINNQLSGLSVALLDLYYDVMLEEYDGPTDPYYLAERDRIISLIDTLKLASARLASLAGGFVDETVGVSTAAAVSIGDLVVLSDTTGGNEISASPESFAITAQVSNLSSAAISDLSARLTINSPAGSVVLGSVAEVAVGAGTLEAADAVANSGADQADVSWSVTFSGDLARRERIVFVVEILEDGLEPLSFQTASALEVLRYDILRRDADLDGMPNDWEVDNGLDPSVDDAQADADTDGVVNSREYELGTDPQLADTDGDNLSDGEETSGGTDGYLTDPLIDDTDGDGVLDDVDGNPTDADPAASTSPPGEPVVAISAEAVTLTATNRFATIDVTNAGSGEFAWAAVSEHPALVTAEPSPENIKVGDGSLVLSLATSFDGTECVNAIVRVVDAGGATMDYRDVTVTAGPAEGCPTVLCGDATGDGNVTATDALAALNAAVSLTSCALNLCDVSGDTNISAVDALMILQHAVGISVPFNCPL